jgi:hypothetical protein
MCVCETVRLRGCYDAGWCFETMDQISCEIVKLSECETVELLGCEAVKLEIVLLLGIVVMQL